jgi:hypothetical protein
MLISLVSGLFSFLRKVTWSGGTFLWEIGIFHLSARKLLVPEISILQIASFFTKNAHHRDHCSHLTGVCGFNGNFFSPHVFTWGLSGDFDQTGLIRHIDSI